MQFFLELKRMVDEMKQGKSYEKTKLLNHEITISFPTETGLPFYSTYKTPTVMSVRGEAKVRADSESQSSVPKSVTASGETRVVLGMKVQERFGFVVPFENQEYIVGLDKNLQVHLPIRSEVEFDKNKKEIRIRLQPRKDAQEVKVLQYRTQPFTSKHDITSLEPVSSDKNTNTIHQEKARKSSLELNDQNQKQRVQFNWERRTNDPKQENESNDKRRQNAMESAQKMARSIASMFSPESTETEYEKYSVKVNPQNDMSMEIRVSTDSLKAESNQSGESDDGSPNAKAPHLERGLGERERKQKLMKEASKKINAAEANAVDISVQLGTETEPVVSITAAMAKSNVDEKSRVLVYAATNMKNDKDHHLSAAVESKTPNTLSMDFEETLKANTPREFDAEIHFGKRTEDNDENSENKIKIQGKAKQTENRKNEIRQSRDAQECSKEKSRTGNKMSPACERANQRAASVNIGEMTITLENESRLKPLLLRAVDAVESLARDSDRVEVSKDREDKEEKNKVKVSFETSSDDEEVDVTVKTPEAKYQFNDIKMSSGSKKRNHENDRDSEGKEDSENDSSTKSKYFSRIVNHCKLKTKTNYLFH